MSWDLEIVVSEKPQHFHLEEFVAPRTSLIVQGHIGTETGNVIIYRREGERSVASFEVWGPSKVEAEDIDERVASLVAAPRWRVQVSVPAGGEKDDVPLASALAVFIAERCKGVVYDPQADAITWPRPHAKLPPLPRSEAKIRLVNLNWYLPRSQASESTATRLLDTLRDACPEAIPRRFGSYEPLQGRMEPDEEGIFLKAFQEECLREVGGGLFFTSRSPCFGGHIFTPHRKASETSQIQDFLNISLDFDGRIIQDNTEWCDRIAALFTELAARLKAFYALGYVERDVYASSRGLGFGSDSEHYPLPRGRWIGIPSSPVWLAWFGPPYKPLVEASLKGSQLVVRPEGIFLRMGLLPLDLDELQGKMPDLPPELIAQMRREDKEVKIKRSLSSKVKLAITLKRPRRIKYVSWEATPAKFIPALD